MAFSKLNLSEPVLRAVHAEGYTAPTPIQQRAVPHILAGRDLLGCAQTGTGKTAAFALPILCRLLEIVPAVDPAAAAAPGPHAPARGHGHSRGHHGAAAQRSPRVPYRPIRVLVLAPTRELALQIHESFGTYGRHTGLRAGVIFGGVGQGPQTKMLGEGVDILIATPGRLIDLMGQGFVSLASVTVFVLDEADRMLDMGFIHDIRRVIAKLPAKRQTLLFSATMPKEITALAATLLHHPVRIEVAPQSTTAERVEQSVYFVPRTAKPELLRHLLESDAAIERALVFTRTKHGADRVAKQLGRAGVHAEAIHGNKSQPQRQRALANFKRGSTRVLVATDIAARGLDIDEVSHVINYDLPNEPESYVHRIGRTARAGASGVAVSFCDSEERGYLRDIERTIRVKVPVAKTPEGLEPTADSEPGHRRGHDHGRAHGHADRARPHAARDQPHAPARGGGAGRSAPGPALSRASSGHGHAATASPRSPVKSRLAKGIGGRRFGR